MALVRAGDADAATAARIEKIIRAKRSVRPLLPLPTSTQSPEEVGNKQRIAAIDRALALAAEHETRADWDACAKEAGDQLGVATEVLATSGDLGKLRALHLQIGMCMALVPKPEDAAPHFRIAALLDESPLKKGLRRMEAEQLYEDTRASVLGRKRGPVTIASDPPGAEVWIDGRKAAGVTPVAVEVRLGSHFVTLRRFRYEPETSYALLQPGSTLRLVLDPARRATLRHQLARLRAGELKVEPLERHLAHALWSRADQLVVLSKPRGPATAVRLAIFDSTTGREIRHKTLATSLGEDELLAGVCGALGERCVVDEPLLPWWAWTLAGAVVVGATAGALVWADREQDIRFCPSAGCR